MELRSILKKNIFFILTKRISISVSILLLASSCSMIYEISTHEPHLALYDIKTTTSPSTKSSPGYITFSCNEVDISLGYSSADMYVYSIGPIFLPIIPIFGGKIESDDKHSDDFFFSFSIFSDKLNSQVWHSFKDRPEIRIINDINGEELELAESTLFNPITISDEFNKIVFFYQYNVPRQTIEKYSLIIIEPLFDCEVPKIEFILKSRVYYHHAWK